MSEGQEGPTRGYYRKPHQLRTDSRRQGEVTYKFVDFLTDLTFGWESRWVLLSYDEMINGKFLPNGTRMPDTASGLLDHKSIRKAIAQALEAGLIEVRETRLGTAYAIHRTYWALVNFLPKWEFFGVRHYTPETDPITPSAGQHPASDDDEHEKESPTPGYHPAGTDTTSSKQRSVIQQPEFQQQAAQSRESALEERQRKKKDTSRNTSSQHTNKRATLAASPRSPSGSPVVCEEGREEEQEEQPDLVTLRTEYATLSQQLEQLDVHKQAGQWARLYKQVQAAEERLRQAEQDQPPAPAEPSEFAKQAEAFASDEGMSHPVAESTEAGVRKERLRAIASDLMYWKGGLKVLRQAQLPKWRGFFKWQIEEKIELLQTEYATLRAECAKPDG